jgi:hypothetical protein
VQPARGEVDERGADLVGRAEPVDVALHRVKRLLQGRGVGLGAERRGSAAAFSASRSWSTDSVGLSASLRPSVNTTACDGVPSR